MSRRSTSPKRSKIEANVEKAKSFLASLPPMGNFGCVLCELPDCSGDCGKSKTLSKDCFPMYVVYGRIAKKQPFRCRMCTGPLTPHAVPITWSDPLCDTPHVGGSGHSWREIRNPITDYFRNTIEEYWGEHGISDPNLLPSSEQRLHRTALNNIFLQAMPATRTKFGVAVRLVFEKQIGRASCRERV